MKLFACDLDGTLFNKEFLISEKNIEALKYAKLKGVEFVIATGRTYKDALETCKKYSLEPYIISNNGACAYSKKGEILYSRCLLNNQLKELLEFLSENKICYEIATNDVLYIPEDWESILEEEFYKLKKEGNLIEKETLNHAKDEMLSQVGLKKISSYKDFFKEKRICFSISVVSFNDKIHTKLNKFIGTFKNISVTPSGRYTLEIMSKYASKGDTLVYLTELLNIGIDNVVAIGDSLNDESMIVKAGIGISVDNADHRLKKVSDFVTRSNEENGVADVIYKFF